MSIAFGSLGMRLVNRRACDELHQRLALKLDESFMDAQTSEEPARGSFSRILLLSRTTEWL